MLLCMLECSVENLKIYLALDFAPIWTISQTIREADELNKKFKYLEKTAVCARYTSNNCS